MPLACTRGNQAFPAGSARGLALGRSFADDFYYRMHILPSVLDVGNLTEKTVYAVEVFNAWLAPVTLQSITGAGTEGLLLTGFELPELVRALTSITGELAASMDGPGSIDATWTFGFSTGEENVLKVTGSRIVTFPLAPDWSRKVTEKLSFWTDVFETRDGSEHRIMMRAMPRWSMEYTALESGERLNMLDSLLAGWGARTFLVPVWWMKSALDVPLKAGEEEAECDTAGRGFEPGGQAVIWQRALKCESATVRTVEPKRLTFLRPVGRDYEEGFVIPARLCRLSPETPVSALASSLVESRLRFEADEPEGMAPAPAGEQINGRDVFPFRHDWTGPRQRSVVWALNERDTGTGLPQRTARRAWPADKAEARDVLFGTREEAEAFKAWVIRQGGRARSFALLLEEDQITPTRGIVQGSNLLYAGNSAYGLLASGLACRSLLFLRTKDGRRQVFSVTSWQEFADGEFLFYADKAWPWTVALEDISRIGFVLTVRFDQDEFELERRHDLFARTDLAMRGVVQ
jgi:hypothetical protein